MRRYGIFAASGSLSQAGGRDCLNVEGRTVEHLRACTGVQFAVAVSCQIASLIGVS